MELWEYVILLLVVGSGFAGVMNGLSLTRALLVQLIDHVVEVRLALKRREPDQYE